MKTDELYDHASAAGDPLHSDIHTLSFVSRLRDKEVDGKYGRLMADRNVDFVRYWVRFA